MFAGWEVRVSGELQGSVLASPGLRCWVVGIGSICAGSYSGIGSSKSRSRGRGVGLGIVRLRALGVGCCACV